MNLKSLIKQCVNEVILESQYGEEDDMHYDGNDLGERDPDYKPSKIQDPTKEEMMQFLQTQSGGDDGWQDEAEVAIYWFASDYHGGQSSNLYSVLSTSPFSPGRLSNGIESEGDEMARMFYDALVSQYGGDSGLEPQRTEADALGDGPPPDLFKNKNPDTGEHSHAPEMRVRSDEPQNNIDEVQRDTPDEKSKFQTDITKWEADNLDTNGRYIGEPLTNYGFTYKVGQLVPITARYSAMATWNQAYKARQINLKMGRPLGMHEGFDPQSMGVNTPMLPGESNAEFYSAQNSKMCKMEENGEKKKTGILSPKGLATVEKWATTMDSRDAAKRMIDSVLRNKLGLTSDDLADTTTFANGLDMIEARLQSRDYQGAYDVAKDTAKEMIEDEGGAGMDENLSTNDLERFAKQEKNPFVRKAMGMPSEDEDVDYVEYVSQRQGEEPFTLKTGNGQEKFEYVNAKYPSGKVDIAVYAFRGDMVYGYNHFRKMFNLQESDITDVRPRDGGANIPREPEDAPSQYTKTNSEMSNMGNLEECVCKNCKSSYTPTYGDKTNCPDCMK